MTKKMTGAFAAVALLVWGLGQALGQGPAAGSPDPKTTITVVEMHCAGCAKRIGNKLYAVAGVGAVHFDVANKNLIVTPQANRALSPRALWEAVEQAADRPVRLQGPSGVFTSKPQS
ncbi:MAG: heavy-metal-associated domain-containing protein [Gemmataceae bacterium]|nr:heavy-metal-associated domain-containing protein [Gemmataceae bacterium]